MNKPTKPRKTSLPDFEKSGQPGEFVEIEMNSVSRDDWASLLSVDPVALLNHQYQTSSDREFVMTAAATVEFLLAQAVSAPASDDAKHSAAGIGRLGKKARQMGLLTDDCFAALEVIRIVRNEFAHDITVQSLEHDPVVSKAIMNHPFANAPFSITPRACFHGLCVMTCGLLHWHIGNKRSG